MLPCKKPGTQKLTRMPSGQVTQRWTEAYLHGRERMSSGGSRRRNAQSPPLNRDSARMQPDRGSRGAVRRVWGLHVRGHVGDGAGLPDPAGAGAFLLVLGGGRDSHLFGCWLSSKRSPSGWPRRGWRLGCDTSRRGSSHSRTAAPLRCCDCGRLRMGEDP